MTERIEIAEKSKDLDFNSLIRITRLLAPVEIAGS